MTRKLIEAFPMADPDILHEPPHVMAELFRFIQGEWHPSPAEKEQLSVHIVDCLHCQILLEMFVAAEVDYNRSHGLSEEPVRELFDRVKEMIHKMQQEPENIGAYIEALDLYGKKVANTMYPVMANHLKKCKACRSAVDETKTLLHEAAREGLIEPLKQGKKR